jgi:hypothetical protein
MPPFSLDETNRFVISGYQQQRPFSSFLPGIAGRLGTPLWAFYVNRGQGIASFGVESKDSPIMEFQPANKAYQVTPFTGFRTFLKLSRGGDVTCYEPFALGNGVESQNQRMVIGANDLRLEETNPVNGISTDVLYFILPHESFAGLARQVTLRNVGSMGLSLDILDGLPVVIPFGVNNWLLKEMGRTLEAWMEVFNLEAKVPFYRVRASVIDKEEVETFQAGHFALAFARRGAGMDDQRRGAGIDAQNNAYPGIPAPLPIRLPVMVDPVAVFGQDTAFYQPAGFYRRPLEELLAQKQITCGRTPCGLFAHQARLEPGESITINSLYGHASGPKVLGRHLERIAQPNYFEGKFLEAQALVKEQADQVETHSANPLFDAYCQQSYLDNVLRGGWPVLLGDPEKPHVYPIYSRKHGDLERDYNAFFIAPEPYSQGEGSYRDVNQNRRDNVRISPRSGDFDICTFMSLIQTDGYNPRVVKGSTFTLTPAQQADVLTRVYEPEKMRTFLAKPFTPGKLLRFIRENEIELFIPAEEFFALALRLAEQHIEAEFFEGYWSDHWEYNLDLIESYLAIFPDRQEELLLNGEGLPFFESPMFVQPRALKYVLANNIPKQVGSLVEDKEKAALIALRRPEQAQWTHTDHGRGPVYRASLSSKLFLTALLKFATLDPWGMGIEMEAGRPGWYDALNGLPSLFGSGMSETYELQRWLSFLRQAIQAHAGATLRLPVEAAALLDEVIRCLKTYNSRHDSARDFAYWDAVSTARETYRASTRLGLDGAETAYTLRDLEPILADFQDKLAEGMQRAAALNGGIPPTYFTYRVDEFVLLPQSDAQGRPYIRPSRFTAQVLPLFLEGPVHAYKVLAGLEEARKLYQQVKDSALFDRKLKMYKVNASLESQPHDIGRARAFPPGWLENESVFLHMEYKYLLETLKARLYEEFFADLPHTLVPFLDPQIYGRSTLENSSFLVSSAHPDETLHGAGFVARLSGSTAEFLSMWHVMMAGKQPFILQKGQLCLALRPALPAWLFKEDGSLSFIFLGRCSVTYHNPHRRDTFKGDIHARRTTLHTHSRETIEITGDIILPPYSTMVRQGEVESIDVWFE